MLGHCFEHLKSMMDAHTHTCVKDTLFFFSKEKNLIELLKFSHLRHLWLLEVQIKDIIESIQILSTKMLFSSNDMPLPSQSYQGSSLVSLDPTH